MKKILILGAGISGLAAVQYFQDKADLLIILDEKNSESPKSFAKNFPENILFIQKLTAEILSQLDPGELVIASPGFESDGLVLTSCRQAGLKITSDLDLFGQLAQVPIVAITGTNGKSTVTKMVSEMIQVCGKKVKTGGNFGVSPLAFLNQESPDFYIPDFYVLEISSAQMELANNLKPYVSAYLNLSPNHLDRHKTMEIYRDLKEKLLKQSQYQIILKSLKTKSIFPDFLSFGESEFNGERGDFYLDPVSQYLKYQDLDLIPRKNLANPEAHNVLNGLAALGIIKILGLDLIQACEVLKTYQPLPHRTERVGIINGVKYINDSKGTTIGATVRAIESFSQEGEIILILGGDGKDQDFKDLKNIFDQKVSQSFVYGRDRELISRALLDLNSNSNSEKITQKITQVETLKEAVDLASQAAKSGQIILFSPACASWDQFKNYSHRGECFKEFLKQHWGF